MKPTKSTLFWYLTLLLTCSCSGGGGSDFTWAGTWLANFVVVQDDCNITAAIPGLGEGVVYVVNQDGSNVVVQNLATNSVFAGGTTNDGDAFLVSSPQNQQITCQNGNIGTVTTLLAFVRSGENSADVEIDVSNSCDNRCDIVAVGVAERG